MFKVLLAPYPAGTTIQPDSHETENVGVITQGELILTVSGEKTRYGPGMWYHVAARATHAARSEKETSEIEFWFYVAKLKVRIQQSAPADVAADAAPRLSFALAGVRRLARVIDSVFRLRGER